MMVSALTDQGGAHVVPREPSPRICSNTLRSFSGRRNSTRYWRCLSARVSSVHPATEGVSKVLIPCTLRVGTLERAQAGLTPWRLQQAQANVRQQGSGLERLEALWADGEETESKEAEETVAEPQWRY